MQPCDSIPQAPHCLKQTVTAFATLYTRSLALSRFDSLDACCVGFQSPALIGWDFFCPQDR